MTCDEHWETASRMTSPNGQPVHPAQGGGWLYDCEPESADGRLVPLPGITPNPARQIRDRCDLRRCCAACGHREGERNPLVLAADGYRVHVSHLKEPVSGYFGMPFTAEGAAA